MDRVQNADVILPIFLIDPEDGLVDVRVTIGQTVLEAAKRALCTEVELNVVTNDADEDACVYSSDEYMAQIKAIVSTDELISFMEQHIKYREEYLGKAGELMENCGFVVACRFKKNVE